jgi:glycosyltransferase involved in cell wall biosynthesis
VKVLILHQFYNTPEHGGSLRSYYLATALATSGIQPVVVTTHNASEILVTNTEGIEVHYLPVTYNNRFNFIKRVFSFLRFVMATVRYAGRFKDAKICYAISTPLTTGVAALWIKWRYGIRYFFEVGDLWPEAPVQMGIVKNPLLKFILYSLEKIIYRQADAVVALSDDIQKEIIRKVPGKPVHVIPNMADTDFFKPEEKSPVLAKKWDVQHQLVIAYIGTLGIANGLDFLMQCAEGCLQHQLPVHFLVCGDGAERNRLESIQHEKKLSNISFVGFKNRNGVREVLNVSDAIMVSFRPLPVLETGSPNKYFDGLAAGKLIITNTAGWIKEEVESHACGFYLSPSSALQLPSVLQPFLSDVHLLKKFQQNARILAETRYARTILGLKFQQLFKG